MSFGGEAIDNLGVIRWFPTMSMLTGLLGNSIGLRRTESESHQRLQDRLVFAARIDREPAEDTRITDFQTADLRASDEGWTTRGRPEGRTGGTATYVSPHLRFRDYFADMRVTVALRLEPSNEFPTLDHLVLSLSEPKRPLFIGRKPCLPSAPLAGQLAEGDTAISALLSIPLDSIADAPELVRMLWPATDCSASVSDYRSYSLTDQRNWISGLHGGGRTVCEGSVPKSRFPMEVT